MEGDKYHHQHHPSGSEKPIIRREEANDYDEYEPEEDEDEDDEEEDD